MPRIRTKKGYRRVWPHHYANPIREVDGTEFPPTTYNLSPPMGMWVASEDTLLPTWVSSDGSETEMPTGSGGGATLLNWPYYNVSTAAGGALNQGTSGATGGSTQSSGQFYVMPLMLPAAINFSHVSLLHSWATGAAGTGSASRNFGVGIYTLAGSTLSLLSSFRWRNEISQNSITAITQRWYWGTNSTSNSSQISGNTSVHLTGVRGISLFTAASASLSAGKYWLVYHNFHRTSAAAVFTGGLRVTYPDVWLNAPPLGSSAGSIRPSYLQGVFSSTTDTNNLTAVFMPGSVNISAITTSLPAGMPAIMFFGSTS